MLKFKTVFETYTKKINCPENWGEVTFEQYADYVDLGKEPDILEVISVFTGIDVENLETMYYQVIQRLTFAIRFAFNFYPVEKIIKTPPEYVAWVNPKTGKTEPWTIGVQPYKQHIAIDQELERLVAEEGKKRNTFHICRELCKQFAGVDIKGAKILDVISACSFFLNSWLILKYASKN